MQPIRLAILFAVANLAAPAAGPLRVMRVTPMTPADPDAAVTVAFDRPVAGGLDATVDARSIFRIDPAVDGVVEWRDPVTLRFTPATPFEPGATYRVVITPSFRAMDGSRLEGAYEHAFRVAPPRVLTGSPAGPYGQAQHVEPRSTFKLLVSAPVDPAALARVASIRLDRVCGGGTIALRPLGIRRIAQDDPSAFRYTGYRGGYPPDTARDRRRVVELAPADPLPLDCRAILQAPQELDGGTARHDWAFRTYGPLRMVAATCAGGRWCATGPVRVDFSTPVRGADVVRRVRIEPAVPFTVRDTAEVSATWNLDSRLEPRKPFAVVVDTLLVDVFGQKPARVDVKAFTTSGYAPSVAYEFGRLLVEREGLRTLAVQHVNVDTLELTVVPVPDSMEAAFLGRTWGWDEPFQALAGRAVRRSIPVAAGEDERRVTGVAIPATGAGRGTLLAVNVSGAALDSVLRAHRPIALAQVTDLAVHARLGVDEAAVWVTGVGDGLPREGVNVTLHDPKGGVRATGRTDARGLARLDGLPPLAEACEGWACGGFDGYIAATLGDDRSLVGVSGWDPDLAPWRFNLWGAWGEAREPAAATAFTERGIYRPGETVHAKAIVRDGPLGALRAPARGDSLKWIFNDREGGVLEERTVAASEFGTADQSLRLPAELPLGDYGLQVQRRRGGQWRTVARARYGVAEYRPPEFLVNVAGDPAPRLAGDTATVGVSARYLFGAPMAGAPVRWVVRQRAFSPWEIEVPGTDGYYVGARGAWWDEPADEGVSVAAESADTLDAGGRLDLSIPLPAPNNGRPTRVSVVATVTDANRQTVASGTALTVHPAAIYIAARPSGERYFWTAGTPVRIDVLAVRPEGGRVAGVEVSGAVVRREWHRVRRVRDGYAQEVGAWVTDTVATCALRTGAEPATCDFTPPAGGSYTVTFTATDAEGRTASTSFYRWAAGDDWVPWNDDSQLKMDVIADRERYTVGDTATVLIASPFTDAEAWITVERERILESRRVRIASGATTLRIPITEAHAPNAFVSVVVVRGRSAAPGPLDDPGRPTMRVGYAELRVTPEVKRLAVELRPELPEYRPGDSARVRLAVRDAAGRGQRAEVTLWAVDEGVLALTGYRTPDPIELLYPRRGLGMRLASNLVSVAAQVPDGQKGKREAGGGGGEDLAAILRSRFQTTAFFLGSVVTGADGTATAAAKLPDNLTTFRVMAVAVTTGDRYGSGESELLVSRPLLARPALPRFVREGDRFAAGVVVNSRLDGEARVRVEAKADGIRLEGNADRTERVAPGRGIETRFEFRATAGDSARFRFTARAGNDADAVALAVPVRPNHHPLAQTVAGMLHDTATVVFPLNDDVDPARSRLEISFGSTPLAFLRGARQTLHVYPYYCTEQVISTALPLIALYRAEQELGVEGIAGPGAAAEIATAVRTLARRQRPDGGIGYWSATDWTSPWLSAYAGRILLEARAAGIDVDDSVLTRLGDYLARGLRQPLEPRFAVARWYTDVNGMLAERVAAADLLGRLGRPDLAAENTLLAQVARMRWEDRVLLASLLARRGQMPMAQRLLATTLAGVRVEGRVAVLPDSLARGHYFASSARPVARLVDALLAIDPEHRLLGPLVERLVDLGRVEATRFWTTQDYGISTLTLMNYERLRRDAGPTRVRIASGRRTLLDGTTGAAAVTDTAVALDRLVERGADGKPVVRLDLRAADGPAYYYLTIRETPRGPQLEPVDRGIRVERWYEDVATGKPIVQVAEGQLVRVRLRVTVPVERHFVVLDDPLPAGLEPVDLSLRTVSPFGEALAEDREEDPTPDWAYGSWDAGLWSPFDHKEMRDDRVVYSATVLWTGTHSATYLARATTAGTFLYPPAWAEEMYNPGVNGRSGGGELRVVPAAP